MIRQLLIASMAALGFASQAHAANTPVFVSADGSVAYETGLSVPLPMGGQASASASVPAPFADTYLAEPSHASGIPVLGTALDRQTVRQEGTKNQRAQTSQAEYSVSGA